MELIEVRFTPGELVVLEQEPGAPVSIGVVCHSDEHVTAIEHLEGRLRGQVAIARTACVRPVLRRDALSCPLSVAAAAAG
ncbi:MAG: hypothetical protein U0869_26370 [Chloroflexota bacterium]